MRFSEGKCFHFSPPQAENFAKSRSENAIFRGEIASKYSIFFGACGGPIIELLPNRQYVIIGIIGLVENPPLLRVDLKIEGGFSTIKSTDMSLFFNKNRI